ncbi:MurT ligase domain-containing protein [Suipraeoptans intestinalis]|uniref:MurT ligase domain-containing protein n=1 Tax=Suipraeoptans intestinalis TaxID=2606628 RepID=UPI0023F483FC|nr:MurT ligase domain-containing protein [Suipraeoptans intestinalis]MDD7771107.1 MurT ligase domain-containing protein [Suipraeoptans intestinalis]MDY3121556.1 MurT ligase domain-containing protein [Suipraeoptans intestinalis]
MGLRRVLAVWAAKAAEKISVKVFHRQGVTWAGKIALAICPNILAELSKQVRKDIFVVCGTNGKTTTNNLLAAALKAEGYRVICNRTGSNMLNGVAAAFVLGAGLNGKIEADYACIEIDEASTRRVFPFFKPDYMVLTNLFRDQLDRYGEIDLIMEILKESIQSAPEMKVIVNGDDALSAYLAKDSGNAYVAYGISKPVQRETVQEIREGRFCKCCGAVLDYEFYHYSQLGSYHCSKCGFQRPKLSFDAEDIHLENGLAFTTEGRKFTTSYRGFYNIYNLLAAYSAARTAGLSLEHFQTMLDAFRPENGRMEKFRIAGTDVLLNLAKNPAGFNQNITAVLEDPSPKDLIIAINDNMQDGIDVSWLWDVDFDRLRLASVESILASGIRCHDMGLRLKYAGIQAQIEADIEKAIDRKLKDGCGNLYVLVNYTALFGTRNVLKNMEESR